MTELDRYLAAATRDNTRRSYQAAIAHFEVIWGGFLPATATSIAHYLADHAEVLAVSTLRQRLAALAQWHLNQGFPDPTKAPLVRKVFKGIRELHPNVEKQARPLQVEQLEQLDHWLSETIDHAAQAHQEATVLQLARDRALIRLGFWRGLRSDELCRLQIEHIVLSPGEGMTLYLPRTKNDRQNLGRTYKAPALQRLCPVEACQDWLDASRLTAGPLFRRVDRWSRIGEQGLHPNSIIPLLRSLFAKAGLPDPDAYSSHSLRRGFATWANANGWDLKTLMAYVGWKDVKSAMRYIDATDPFASQRVPSTRLQNHAEK